MILLKMGLTKNLIELLKKLLLLNLFKQFDNISIFLLFINIEFIAQKKFKKVLLNLIHK